MHKKTVKAYALLEKKPLVDEEYTLTLPIYRRKKDAEATKSVYRLRHYKVVPCEITYSTQ